MSKHNLILEGVKKKKDKPKNVEFDISQLYNYLKSYVGAKFKTGEVKLKELKLDVDYFYIELSTYKEKFDSKYIITSLQDAVAKKFAIDSNDIAVTNQEYVNPNNKDNLLITIEYKKGDNQNEA